MSNLVRILLAIFLPPLAVLMTAGIGLQFLLNILLTVLGIVPGMAMFLCVLGFSLLGDGLRDLSDPHLRE